MSRLWRIDELARVVALALDAAGYRGPASARVRSKPDLRTIRYYTTLGLLDRPAEMRGRTAYYSRRHAMQLVAIKRLQERGATLLQVQQLLAGADERTLAKYSGVPGSFWQRLPEALQADSTSASGGERALRAQSPPESQTERALQERWWLAAPRPTPDVATPQRDQGSGEDGGEHKPGCEAAYALHLHIAPAVSLVVQDVRPEQLDNSAVRSIRQAARPVVEALQRLGLLKLERGGGRQSE